MTRPRSSRRLRAGILAVTFAVAGSGSGFVVRAASAAAAVRTQWVGSSTFGIGFNNPMSAWANASMWQSTTASVSMRGPLKTMGYTDAQLDQMSADEMIKALRGGKAGSSSGAVAPASPPPVVVPPAPVVYNPQLANAKTQIAKGDLSGIVFPVTTATKFTPVKKRLVTKQLIQTITKDPAAQKALNEVIEAGLKGYDQAAAPDGLQNDVAGSMAFFVGACDLIINDGVEPDPEGLTLVARMLQQQMESPQVKKVAAADKQRMHEYLVGFASVVLATYYVSADAKDTATVNALKDGCNAFGKTMLSADFSTFKITGFGLEKETP